MGQREGVESSLPGQDEVGRFTRSLEVVGIVGAVGMLTVELVRLARHGALLRWWTPLLALAAWAAADLASGCVHWFADTWGRETMPVLGRRLLRPFRVHHVNPQEFLQRDAIDTNGDVAAVGFIVLLGAHWIPLHVDTGRAAALFVVLFALVAIPTNQIHQWAHMPRPPALVRWLQRSGLILNGKEHARHHAPPYASNYCITTGWCNRWLMAMNAFGRLERLVTRVTGALPRHDEREFVRQFER